MTLGQLAEVYVGEVIVRKHKDSDGWVKLYEGNLDYAPMMYSQYKIGTIEHKSDKIEIFISED